MRCRDQGGTGFRAPLRVPGGIALLVAIAFAAPAAAGPTDHQPATAPSPAAIDAAVRTIQNTCFAAYPADLLAVMSGHPGPPPAEVLENPALQMKYLRTEEVEERGLFYPSSLDDIRAGLAAVVRPGLKFLDLGSGDGRVVFLAVVLGADATGIEYDARVHAVAKEALARLTATVPRARVRLRRGDFFRADWSGYDVIFYFGSGTFAEDRMFAKLAREMKPDAMLLLAHGPDPPAGFELVEERGVVRAWRLERPDAAGEPAAQR